MYLPAGTYLVSRPLVKRYADGRFGSGMILIGDSASDTVIRLADHAPGFGNADAPRGVVMTTAKLLDGTPTSGGKDYTNKGEGNDAYENFIENLTIDVGAGNPGAIGIDYLANNIGAIRDVRVTAPSGSGADRHRHAAQMARTGAVAACQRARLRHRHRGRQYRIRRHARPRQPRAASAASASPTTATRSPPRTSRSLPQARRSPIARRAG